MQISPEFNKNIPLAFKIHSQHCVNKLFKLPLYFNIAVLFFIYLCTNAVKAVLGKWLMMRS
jgi:hypothetical protein